MAKPGRKRKPQALLEASGSWRAKIRTDEPPANGRAPVCPAFLKDDDRKVWKDIVPKISKMGILSSTDKFALARYCVYWNLWQKELLRPDRCESSMERYANQLSKIESKFALTPCDRAAMAVVPEKKAKSGKLKYFKTEATG